MGTKETVLLVLLIMGIIFLIAFAFAAKEPNPQARTPADQAEAAAYTRLIKAELQVAEQGRADGESEEAIGRRLEQMNDNFARSQRETGRGNRRAN